MNEIEYAIVSLESADVPSISSDRLMFYLVPKIYATNLYSLLILECTPILKKLYGTSFKKGMKRERPLHFHQ
jgi:hypothetical protein